VAASVSHTAKAGSLLTGTEYEASNHHSLTDIAAASTTISAGTGLTGGGSLAANRTISADVGTGSTQVAAGNHTHAGPQSGTAFPVTPAAGDIYFRTDTSQLCFYDGSAWQACLTTPHG
jgi:hypothetical protein